METPTASASAEKEGEKSPPVDELITIIGGVDLEVEHLDGSKESVKVRQIPVSKIQQFAFALGNEAEMIELYCDKPKDWADTLTYESASAAADKGQEINLPFFGAWFRRQAKWRESQSAGAIADLEKKLTKLIEQASRSGSSAPPSPITTS